MTSKIKNMKQKLMSLLTIVVSSSCNIKKEEKGELPGLDVDISAEAGELPEYDVN